MDHGHSDYLDKDMKRTILKLVILSKASSGKVYPYSLIKELKCGRMAKYMGLDLKNDVYNTISALEKLGFINVSKMLEDGRAKNYYTITRKGRMVLRTTQRIRVQFIKEAARLFR